MRCSPANKSMTRVTTARQMRRQAERKAAKKTSSQPGLSQKQRTALVCGLLALVTFLTYARVLSNNFVVLDDQDYVTQNPHVQDGINWTTIKWAFTTNRAANWHPLTWLSHAFDCQLFGLNPAGHHFDSLFLHVLSTVLVFLLLLLATDSLAPSLLIAFLFACHPLNVESVAWIAERKNVLSTFFFLAAIGAYGWYARKPDWRPYLLVALLFALGLMAKPMVITLPLVLLLLDYWPLNRTPGSPPSSLEIPQSTVPKLIGEKMPLLLLSAASAVLTIKAQVLSVRTLADFPLTVRIQNAVVAYAMYLWRMIWPAHLAALYPHPGRTLHAWQIILSAIVLTVISGFVIAFRSKRYLVVGWLWFLGTLVPVIGLMQVGYAAMADRYAYIPLLGIFIMIAFGSRDLAEAKKVQAVSQIAVAACVVIVLAVLTFRQQGHWSSEYDLWSHAAEVTNNNAFAHNAAGEALLNPATSMSPVDLDQFDTPAKRMDQARWHYEQALQICRDLAERDARVYMPWVALTQNNLGELDRQQHRIDDARQHHTEALQIYPSLIAQGDIADVPFMAKTINDLAYLDKLEKHSEDARAHFAEALATYRQLQGATARQYLPEVISTLNNLAVTEADLQQPEQAAAHFQEALRIGRQMATQEPAYLPDLALTLGDMGTLDLDQKRPDDARQHYQESANIYRDLAQHDPKKFFPLLAGMLSNLGFAEKNLNQAGAARAHYEEAMAIYRQLSRDNPRRFAAPLRQTELALAELNAQSSPK